MSSEQRWKRLDLSGRMTGGLGGDDAIRAIDAALHGDTVLVRVDGRAVVVVLFSDFPGSGEDGGEAGI